MGTKRLTLGETLNKYKLYYILLIPGLLYIFIFHYIPLFGLVIAFKDYHPAMGVSGIFTSEFVGFRHFKTFFSSYYFKTLMRNTLWISFLKLSLGGIAPIIFAFMINELYGKTFKRFVQTVSYLPYFISWVVVVSLVSNFFSSEGLINSMLQNMGQEATQNYMTNRATFVPLVIGSHIWKGMGYGSIVYLAAIAGIDQEQFEAADLDGATRMQKIWHISIPSIMPIISIMLIMSVGSIMSAGQEQILLMYSEPVYEVGDIIDTFVFRAGLQQQQYSYSTAVGLFKSVVSAALLLGANWLSQRLGQEGIW